jgi:GTP pyrophosphokinase
VCRSSTTARVDDLFAGIGTGKVTPKQVANRIEEILEEGSPEQLEAAAHRPRQSRQARGGHQGGQAAHAAVDADAAAGEPGARNCGVVVKGDPT